MNIHIHMIHICIRAGQARHRHANTETSTRHRPPNTNTARIMPTRHEHANTAWTTTPNAGRMPKTGDTDTANMGNWAQASMNIQMGSSQISAAQSARTLSGYGQHVTNTDNTTRPTRKPIQHGTARQVATRHATG